MNTALLIEAGVRNNVLNEINEVLQSKSVEEANSIISHFGWGANYYQLIGLNFRNFWTEERIKKCLEDIGETELSKERLIMYITDPRGNWYAQINLDEEINEERKELLINLIENSKHKILRRVIGYE